MLGIEDKWVAPVCRLSPAEVVLCLVHGGLRWDCNEVGFRSKAISGVVGWWLAIFSSAVGVGIGVLGQPQPAVRFIPEWSSRELNRAAGISLRTGPHIGQPRARRGRTSSWSSFPGRDEFSSIRHS
jgi:hypothetical protein